MNNQLETIVGESGLEKTKADSILRDFQNYFEIAAEWEAKARTIVVTSADQKADMAMARTGRLFLREKRIAVEKRRKELKEQSLREGKAIDGVANVLKALIEPIEKYLDEQERFVEIAEQKEKERLYREACAKAEAERLAKEAEEAKERERMKAENERLRAEAATKDAQMAKERAEAEAKAKAAEAERARLRAEAEAKERAAAREKARIQAEADEKIRAAKREQDRLMAEQRVKEEAARLEEQRKAAEAKAEADRLAAELAKIVTCPYCGGAFVLGELYAGY